MCADVRKVIYVEIIVRAARAKSLKFGVTLLSSFQTYYGPVEVRV